MTDLSRGRLDIAAVRLAELVCRSVVEPALGGVPLWNYGVGEIVRAAVEESRIPKVPLTPVDLARLAGILKPDPRLPGVHP